MSTATATQTKTKIRLPSQWKVVMLNDDTTPMEFVVSVLMSLYEKSEDDAVTLMKTIHNSGRAVVYVSTLELVRQKVEDTLKLAKSYNFNDFKVIKEQA